MRNRTAFILTIIGAVVGILVFVLALFATSFIFDFAERGNDISYLADDYTNYRLNNSSSEELQFVKSIVNIVLIFYLILTIVPGIMLTISSLNYSQTLTIISLVLGGILLLFGSLISGVLYIIASVLLLKEN